MALKIDHRDRPFWDGYVDNNCLCFDRYSVRLMTGIKVIELTASRICEAIRDEILEDIITAATKG